MLLFGIAIQKSTEINTIRDTTLQYKIKRWMRLKMAEHRIGRNDSHPSHTAAATGMERKEKETNLKC
jgi:hypothetical protein